MSTSLATVAGLLDELRRTGLLSADQLDEVKRAMLGRFFDVRELAKYLAQRGWLTIYQVGQLMKSRCAELVLGPYHILDNLGVGGAASVFKAKDSRSGRIVALKVIYANLALKPETVTRFQRESRMVQKLSHPNIIRAYDAGSVGTTLYLAMELIQGTDLRRKLQLNGTLPVPEAANYIWQTAQGLQYAHERGLVHRDIKPGNLFLTEPGSVIRIGDFGLARARQSSGENFENTVTAEGNLVGTPDYISPEQARNARHVDIRADIYSLGCTMYHLVTGQPPFPIANILTKLLMHAEHDPLPVESLNQSIPARLAEAIRKMMAKKPKDRYQTPAEVAAAVKTFKQPSS
jgi:serine/threonine-protein kinase